MGEKGLNPAFDECLKKKRIWEFSRGKALVGKELDAAASDLSEAKRTFANESYKWATIQSYYSMFHSARALLYHKNFREKSHYCLIIALRYLYVEEKLLPLRLVEAIQEAKALREQADYGNEWSKQAAETLLASAEEFLAASRKLTSNREP
jgi:uncharacterized protein (UPF0332 family)